MFQRLRVGVIFGGKSGEHEVSLVSAKSVMQIMDPRRYEVIPIGITKTGLWVGGKNVWESLTERKVKNLARVFLNADPQKKGVWYLGGKSQKFQPLDVVFPVLHGPFGEDGTVQGALETAGIPYVGCSVEASSLAMDKFASKMMFAAYGLAQTDFLHFTRGEVEQNFSSIQKEVTKKLGFPCFVKPSNMGSSVGISKVKKTSELKAALQLAAQFDASIVIEKGVDAREIEFAVLGNEKPICSVPGEVVPSREFYDFYAKYIDNSSGLFIPAKISATKMKEGQELAVKAYRALQCSGMARVDFLLERRTQKFYLNEINTIPGFTSISMYPKLFAASGIPYSKLIDRLIQLALERHNDRQKNQMSFASGSEWYKK
ncbi:MAG: D-alanine--D-alanine ligase family protein [Patescibacteria group bacterium]